jgi:hypothetical protein
MYGGVDIENHVFFTWAVVGVKWSASRSSALPPGTTTLGGWVCLRTGLHVQSRKILPLRGLELRFFGLPGRGQSLHRLFSLFLPWFYFSEYQGYSDVAQCIPVFKRSSDFIIRVNEQWKETFVNTNHKTCLNATCVET